MHFPTSVAVPIVNVSSLPIPLFKCVCVCVSVCVSVPVCVQGADFHAARPRKWAMEDCWSEDVK